MSFTILRRELTQNENNIEMKTNTGLIKLEEMWKCVRNNPIRK